MLPDHEFVDLRAAIALRNRSMPSRLALMAAIGVLLWAISAWTAAPLWWAVYASLQLLQQHTTRVETPVGRALIYAVSIASFAVAGYPAWHLWTQAGTLGIAASTMFLCGMLVQQIVSTMAARKLFWFSAAPLMVYLVFIPPLVFGLSRLNEGIVASACGVIRLTYLTVMWLGQQKALLARANSRRRAEDLQRTAEAASKAKTDFLAAMSHELRTPMNAVLGSAALLARTDLTAEQRGLVTMLSDGGSVLMHVLNDVLDLSKIEAGKLLIDPTTVDIHDFARRCAALWRANAQDKGLGFNLSISPRTPQYLTVDATRCGQIAFNLVSNAVKFTESGAVSLNLDAEETAPGAWTLVLSVTDSGIGMSRETLDSLFGAFQQADRSTTRRFGGTGLGLSISQKLAQMMGGEITAVSREGLGSIFTLRLPCTAASSVSPAVSAEVRPDTRQPRDSARILVAEDNPANQRIIDLFLRPIGAEVTLVENGQQALDALATGAFDLVLMDMQMPVLDGLEATRRLRAGGGPNADIPVLALTANVMEGHRQACEAAGMDGHIAKPIDARLLLAAVMSALEEVDEASMSDAGALAGAA